MNGSAPPTPDPIIGPKGLLVIGIVVLGVLLIQAGQAFLRPPDRPAEPVTRAIPRQESVVEPTWMHEDDLRRQLAQAQEEIETLRRQVKAHSSQLDKKRQETKVSTPPTVDLSQQVAEDKRLIHELEANGLVVRYHVDFNQVWVSSALWDGLDRDSKSNVVRLFGEYFGLKGSTGRVTVYGDRNDTVFAKLGSWSGVEILR